MDAINNGKQMDEAYRLYAGSLHTKLDSLVDFREKNPNYDLFDAHDFSNVLRTKHRGQHDIPAILERISKSVNSYGASRPITDLELHFIYYIDLDLITLMELSK